MRNFSITLSVAIMTGLSFFVLSLISSANQYTSVRQYNKPSLDTTSPVIQFLNYTDGDIVSTDAVDIQLKVTDNITSQDRIIVEWWGKHVLKTWFNPIIVSAQDEAWNVASSYIILEKK